MADTVEPTLDDLYASLFAPDTESPEFDISQYLPTPRPEENVEPAAPAEIGPVPRGKVAHAINTNLPPEARALLDTIAGDEAVDYNTSYGGRKVSDLSQHPNLHTRIEKGKHAGETSSAFGRYQFIKQTWDEQAAKLGLSDLSPANQDMAAWDLASSTYGNATKRNLLEDLRSDDPKVHNRIAQTLHNVWTSLPGGPEQGAHAGSYVPRYQQALQYHLGAGPQDQGAPETDDNSYQVKLSDGSTMMVDKAVPIEQVGANLQKSGYDIYPVRNFTLPSGQDMEVPAHFSDEQVLANLKKNQPDLLGAAGAPTEESKKGIIPSFVSSAESGFGALARGAGELGKYAGQRFDMPSVTKAGEYLTERGTYLTKDAEGRYKELTPQEVEAMGGWGKIRKYGLEPIAGGLGSIASILPTFAVPGGRLISTAAGTAGLGVQELGSMAAEADTEGRKFDVPTAAPYAAGAAALGVAGMRWLGPLKTLVGEEFLAPSAKAFINKVINEQGPEAAAKAIGSRFSNIAKEVGANVTGMAVGDIGTRALERMYAGKDPLSPEALDEYGGIGIYDLPTGALFGGIHGMGRHAVKKGMVEEAQLAERAKAAEDARLQEATQVQEAAAAKEQEAAAERANLEQQAGIGAEVPPGAQTTSVEPTPTDTGVPNVPTDVPPPAPTDTVGTAPTGEEIAPTAGEPPVEPTAPVTPPAPTVEQPASTLADSLGMSKPTGANAANPSLIYNQLNDLDSANPEHHDKIVDLLDKAASRKMKMDSDKVEFLYQQMQAQKEAQNAQQVPQAGTPDGSSGPQPSVRKKGRDQTVPSERVEPSRQGEQAPEVKAPEEIEKKNASELFEPESIEQAKDVGFKSKYKLINMPIADFLKLAEKTSESEAKRSRVENILEKGEKLRELPYLYMYTKGDDTQQLVEGHEGRHRAMALARRGYTHMPVQIRSDIRWSEQKDPSKFDYRERWPTELVGENGDVVPFPITREEADKSYSSAKVETSEVKAPEVEKAPLKAPEVEKAPLKAPEVEPTPAEFAERLGAKIALSGRVTPKANPQLQKALVARDTKNTLDILSNSTNPIIKHVAEHARRIPDLKVAEDDAAIDARMPTAGAMYTYATNTASVRKKYANNEHVITHELVHGLVHHAIKAPEPKQRPAVSALKKLYAAVKSHPEMRNYGIAVGAQGHPVAKRTKKEYGVKDIHEFVSEGLSNPEFQQRLSQIEYQNTSAWNKFTQTIANILGISKPSALTEFLHHANELIESVHPEKGKDKGVSAVEVGGKEGRVPPEASALELDDEPPKGPITKTTERTLSNTIKDTIDKTSNVFGGDLWVKAQTDWVNKHAGLREAIKDSPEMGWNGKLRADLQSSASDQRYNVIREAMNTGTMTFASDGTLMAVDDTRVNLDKIWRKADKLGRKDFDFVARVNRGEEILEEDKASRAKVKTLLDKAKKLNAHADTLVGKEAKKFIALAKQYENEADKIMARVGEGREQLVTAEDIAKRDSILAAKPKIKDLLKDLRDYNKSLVELVYKSGAISRELADEWNAKANYIPLYKSLEDLIADPNYAFKQMGGGAKTLPAVKALKGGEHAINLFENQVKHTAFMATLADENMRRKNSAYMLELHGAARKTGKDDKQAILFKENGNNVYYHIDDPMLFEAFKTAAPLTNSLMKFMKGYTQTFRAVTLVNPLYWYRQLIRDPLHANLVSKTGLVTPIDAIIAFGKILTGLDKNYKELKKRGVVGVVDSLTDPSRFYEEFSKRKGPLSPKHLPGWVMHIHEAADAATRSAVYAKALKEAKRKGMSGEDAKNFATMRAREIINFANRGKASQLNAIRATVPFFSATLNSMDSVLRAATGKGLNRKEAAEAKRLFYSRLMALASYTVAYTLASQDDEDYIDSPDFLNNWLVPTGDKDKPFQMIPIPFEVGFIGKVLPELMVRLSSGTLTLDETKKYAGQAAKQTLLPPLPLPQILKPLLELKMDYDLYTGRAIEGADKKLPLEERTKGASEISKLWGPSIGLSPAQAEHLGRGWFTELYSAIGTLSDAYLHEGPPDPAKARGEISTLLGGGRGLYTKPEQSRHVDTFYEMQGAAQAIKDKVTGSQNTGDMVTFNRIMANPENHKKYYASDAGRENMDAMSVVRNAIKKLENSSLPPRQKELAIRERTKYYNKLAKEGVERLRKLGIEE
jgi:muramidase (phage lysozyme)